MSDLDKEKNYHPHKEDIPKEAREVIADALLASSSRNDNYPAYNELQLNRRRRRISRAEEYFAISAAESSNQHSISEEISDRAGLTQAERTAWELYSAGYKASEIARILHVTRPTAVRFLRSAARRIAACESTFNGLEHIYLREVHKRIYKKPMHCTEHPCRRLGYCKYSPI